MELTPTLPMAMALVTILIVLVLSSWCRRSKALKLPPSPRGWPVFGSLGALAATLAARHSPLMHLRLGHAVVASSADAARLILKTHDLAFIDRPQSTAGKHVAYGYRGVLHTPYGAYWRMARTLCSTELFSGSRVHSYDYIRRQEVWRGGRAVALREHLVDATLRNVLGMSYRCTREEVFAVAGAVSNVGEWVQWLGWLDPRAGRRPEDEAGKRLSKVHETTTGSSRVFSTTTTGKSGTSGDGASSPAARDLVDVLLQQLAEEEGETGRTPSSSTEARLTRDGIKAFVQDIIVGGTDIIVVAMEWAMSELPRRPDAAAATTDELDRI